MLESKRVGQRSIKIEELALLHPNSAVSRFRESVAIYAIAKLIMFAGSVIGVVGAGLSLSHIPYMAVIYASYHDDSTWYSAISTFGYMREDTPFFPLFPILCFVIHKALGASVVTSGIVLSNGFMILDILLLASLLRRTIGDKPAMIGVLLWALYPMSVFLSSDYTESLFMFGILGSFLFLQRGKYLTASIFCAVASLTRNTGVLLLIPILLEIMAQYKANKRIKITQLVPIASIGLAVGSFCIYQWVRFGNPFMFSSMEHLWGRSFMFPLETVYKAFASLTTLWSGTSAYGHVYYIIQYSGLILACASLPTIWRRLPRSWFWFMVAQIMIPLCDPGIGVQTITGYEKHITDYLFSFGRFSLTMFPMFPALAIRLSELKIRPRIAFTAYAAGTVLCTGVALTLHLFIG